MDAIVIKKSELIEQIREDFKLWEEMSPDIDEGYFDEEDVQSYLNFLIERYHDEWVVIDVRRKEVMYERTFRYNSQFDGDGFRMQLSTGVIDVPEITEAISFPLVVVR